MYNSTLLSQGSGEPLLLFLKEFEMGANIPSTQRRDARLREATQRAASPYDWYPGSSNVKLRDIDEATLRYAITEHQVIRPRDFKWPQLHRCRVFRHFGIRIVNFVE